MGAFKRIGLEIRFEQHNAKFLRLISAMTIFRNIINWHLSKYSQFICLLQSFLGKSFLLNKTLSHKTFRKANLYRKVYNVQS